MKKDYKVLQLGFRSQKEYEKYHTKAVRFFGSDSRMADCAYARECMKNNEKLKKQSSRDKVKALVEGQTMIVNLIQMNVSTEYNEKLIKLSKEVLNLWVN